jgi:lipopolysaccharide export system protein LptC
MSPRLILLLVLLLIAALGSWYIARDGGDRAAPPVANPAASHGYYLEDARILGTAEDGSLLYEIRAEFAEQQGDESILFSAVEIEYSPETDIPWSITADTALLAPDEPRVLLQGNVRAYSAAGPSGDETELLTSLLSLDPARYIAETDERIRIRIGDRSLTGTGMLASLNDNRLEIRSNVSGRFVP